MPHHYLVHTVSNVTIFRETWRVTSATPLTDEHVEEAVCGETPEGVTDVARIDMETSGADRTVVAIEEQATPTVAPRYSLDTGGWPLIINEEDGQDYPSIAHFPLPNGSTGADAAGLAQVERARRTLAMLNAQEGQ
jgi:hypothetical protein